jgi:hypothetical protein
MIPNYDNDVHFRRHGTTADYTYHTAKIRYPLEFEISTLLLLIPPFLIPMAGY